MLISEYTRKFCLHQEDANGLRPLELAASLDYFQMINARWRISFPAYMPIPLRREAFYAPGNQKLRTPTNENGLERHVCSKMIF